MNAQRMIFTGYADGSNLRTETFGERNYLVVPVVALVEGAIQGANVAAPEFVPAAVFGKAPGGWNGEPVTWHHPQVDGMHVSANSPEILERYQIGTVFNSFADLEAKKLHLEAWLDVDTALPEGRAVLVRLERGDVVEISVGAFVMTQPAHGVTTNGVAYQSEWTEVIPDHLAILPEGVTGACSVEMGCGTRAFSASEDRLSYISTPTEEMPVKTFTRKEILAKLMQAFGVSRGPEDNPEPITTAGSCSCGGECDALSQTGGAEMDMTAQIDAILADVSNPFTEAEREFLAGLGEDRLAAFIGPVDAVEETEETATEEAETVVAEEATEEEETEEEEATEAVTVEETVTAEEAPAEVVLTQEAFDALTANSKAFLAIEASNKQAAVDRIAALTDVYSTDELLAQSPDQLKKLEKAIATSGEVIVNDTTDEDETVVSYAGRKLEAVDAKSASANPPRGWDIALEKLRASAA